MIDHTLANDPPLAAIAKVQAHNNTKLAKRAYVKLARDGLQSINELVEAGFQPSYLAARNCSFGSGCLGLYMLGFQPDQIAKFISSDVQEALVMATLRRYFIRLHDELVEAHVLSPHDSDYVPVSP